MQRTCAVRRLYRAPPALAAPSYLQAIAETMPASVDVFGVCSPGRGALEDLPPHSDVEELVQTLRAFMASRARPTVLLGHSLGALHALAVAADDALRRTHGRRSRRRLPPTLRAARCGT
ncbi:alpha/beta fold hydrolase [Paeniglutamicibacter kerguelensis]|uniref:alpha/beta fold hydrolase n=1 Tax=Paeniglutamicibacter kerguelensis TaxID=254788 RepID=UPI00360E12B9